MGIIMAKVQPANGGKHVWGQDHYHRMQLALSSRKKWSIVCVVERYCAHVIMKFENAHVKFEDGRATGSARLGIVFCTPCPFFSQSQWSFDNCSVSFSFAKLMPHLICKVLFSHHEASWCAHQKLEAHGPKR